MAAGKKVAWDDIFLAGFPFEPTPCQRNFFNKAGEFLMDRDSDIMLLSGYAGTGKTAALAAFVKTLAKYGRKCILLAPTGRAAKVLSSYSGMTAYTIHKHIYRQKNVGDNGFGEFQMALNKEKEVIYVVDEVSLMGIGDVSGENKSLFGSGDLLSDLVNYSRSGRANKILLVGDKAQLPPVGLTESPALDIDYIRSSFGSVCAAEMSTVVRQAKESGILHNATLIRDIISLGPSGMLSKEKLKFELEGFDDIEAVTGGELIEKITDAYSLYGEDETMILCRSNKRAIRYNNGVRAMVQFKEEELVKGERLMVVKNCYQFLNENSRMDFIANGDFVVLERLGKREERYGLHFADARLSFPDYDDLTINAKVILDTLSSESPSLTYEQNSALYKGVNEDYAHIKNKRKRYEAVREDPYFNAIQLKYSNAVTCHKSQGGQWDCVFIDNPFWKGEVSFEDLKWLYTAITRAKKKVYLVNFKDLSLNLV